MSAMFFLAGLNLGMAVVTLLGPGTLVPWWAMVAVGLSALASGLLYRRMA